MHLALFDILFRFCANLFRFYVVEAPAPPSSEIRSKLGEAVAKVSDLRNTNDSHRGDTFAADLKAATAEVLDLDALLRATQTSEAYDIQAAAWNNAITNPPAGESRGPSAAFTDLGGRQHRSVGHELVARDDYAEWAKDGGDRRMPPLELARSLVSPEMRTLLDEDGGDNAAYLLPVGQPIAPTPRQMRFFLRDVLSVQSTGLSVIPYVRELNPATNETGATGIAEAAAKPEVVMEWEEDTAVVKKLAAWIPASMEILSDAPTLLGYVNTRLSYMLKVRETAQILYGNGLGPQMKGITLFSGIQTQGTVADDPAAVFAAAAGKVENVDGEANGVAQNPLDYWLMAAERHSTQFDGAAVANVPFSTPSATVWDMPVIRTRAVPQNSAIVADWAMGATLFDRMLTTIRQSDSHDDYFVKNKVAILAEERVALAVHRPDFFVSCTTSFT